METGSRATRSRRRGLARRFLAAVGLAPVPIAAPALAALNLAAGVAAQGTDPGLLWTHAFPPGQAALAVGGGGQFVAVRQDFGSGLMLSVLDAQDPAVPLWEAGDLSVLPVARAAYESDVILGVELEVTGIFTARGHLVRLDPGSAVPRWDVAFPEALFSLPAVDVSRDGRVIVSVYPGDADGIAEVRVHDPEDGTVLRRFDVGPSQLGIGTIDLSPDGSVLCFGGGGVLAQPRLVDLATGQELFVGDGRPPEEQALSQRGRVFVTRQQFVGQPARLRVYERAGPTDWQLVLEDVMPPEMGLERVAVSDDGSTVAAGWSGPGEQDVLLRAYDVAARALLFERAFASDPLGVDNSVRDVDLSADGRRLAVGMLGTFTAPELEVYDPWADELVVSHPLGGSTAGLELSPDGRFLVAARAPGHLTVPHSFRRVHCYRLDPVELAVLGVPHAGATVEVSVRGPPGGRALLLSALGSSQPPLGLGAVGRLLLDPATLVVQNLGVYDAGGEASGAFVVPGAPALVGMSVHLQGASLAPEVLGGESLAVTVLP